MNSKPDFVRRICLFLLATGLSGWSQGTIIWNGPDYVFTQPAGVGASVQDYLTPGVALTRDTSQGLFNAATEVAYTHTFSPQDTEWAYGLLANYSSLSYTDWEDWNGKHPPNMVGQPAVVHLISENIFLSLTFTSWGGNGGGFSYVRSTPNPVPEPSTPAVCGLCGLLAWLVFRKSYAESGCA